MISFEGFVLEDSGPVYLQIMRYIRQGIAAGAIGDREEVPSRRALSALLGVNPNTIQKAYHMLEEEGIIQSRSGAKSYTNVDRDTIERIRREQLRSETSAWVKAMKQMGVSWEEAEALAEELWTLEGRPDRDA
ncbi:GntR family transcriptional regulator [uncultured Acetatifactor sp.]|uniref:GntR family transcriptional regulator n=1 Tax=uncultured Acetatifactor sp. TaxID=1671927 RepID=UPI0025E2C894|nr:GntR family transcriptional regulator [uncultured Acetatifactor sp.]